MGFVPKSLGQCCTAREFSFSNLERWEKDCVAEAPAQELDNLHHAQNKLQMMRGRHGRVPLRRIKVQRSQIIIFARC